MAASDETNSLQINHYLQSHPLITADLHHESGFIEKKRKNAVQKIYDTKSPYNPIDFFKGF